MKHTIKELLELAAWFTFMVGFSYVLAIAILGGF